MRRLAGSSPTPRWAQPRVEEPARPRCKRSCPLPGRGCAAPALPARGGRIETEGTGEEKARGSGKAAGQAWGAGEGRGAERSRRPARCGGTRALGSGGSGSESGSGSWAEACLGAGIRRGRRKSESEGGGVVPRRPAVGRGGADPAGPGLSRRGNAIRPPPGAVRPRPLPSSGAAAVGRVCDWGKRGLLPPRSPAGSPGRGARVLPPSPPYFPG